VLGASLLPKKLIKKRYIRSTDQVNGYYGCQALVNQLGVSTNPYDQADHLKATQYIGSYYNADELKTMIEKFDGDPMRLPVILTAL
jgi:hypothetical protein